MNIRLIPLSEIFREARSIVFAHAFHSLGIPAEALLYCASGNLGPARERRGL